MKELGQFLQKEREKQGLSLDDMASRTKIHIQKLVDIEEGNRDQLPAKVFCVGLIKSYARELRVDMDKVNQLVELAFAEPQKEVVTPVTEPQPVKKASSPDEGDQMVGRFKVPKFVMIGASLVLSLVLLMVIFQVVEKMNSYSEEEALPDEVFVSQDELEKDQLVEENDKKPKDQASSEEETQPTPEKIETIAKQPDQPATKEPTAPEVKTEPESEPQKPNVTQTAVKPMDMSEGDFSEDNFDDTPSNRPADVVSDNKLTLTALEPVRAEVVWSDGYVQVMLLKSKETKTLVFSQPITLRVNNGGAIQVSFNDAEKSVPGPFNKPIEIQYP